MSDSPSCKQTERNSISQQSVMLAEFEGDTLYSSLPNVSTKGVRLADTRSRDKHTGAKGTDRDQNEHKSENTKIN